MDTYAIRTESLSRQLADRPKLLFFLGMIALEFWIYQRGGVWQSAAIGAFFGMLPSVRFGLASSMAVQGAADWIRAEQWLQQTGHRWVGSAWVPPLPRWLYFNTQMVRYADGHILGPRVLLKRLRDALRAEAGGEN